MRFPITRNCHLLILGNFLPKANKQTSLWTRKKDFHLSKPQRCKLTPTLKTASFSKESAIWTIFDPRITQTWLKMMRESCVCLRSKEIWVFGSFRLFFKISQVFQIKKKWLIKNFEAIVRKFLLFWNKRFQRSLFHKIGPSLTKSLYN